MTIQIIDVNHVNVTVTPDLENAAKHFYANVLGLKQIPKPVGTKQFVGAWYQVGQNQIHLSIEANPQNDASGRHVCYRIEDLDQAAAQFQSAGIEIIPDAQAPDGSPPRRFFVRDPGGNLIEITK
jgi:catechol 2,3-dioxygenase-like lactoylglutathione lyase family enzyme